MKALLKQSLPFFKGKAVDGKFVQEGSVVQRDSLGEPRDTGWASAQVGVGVRFYGVEQGSEGMGIDPKLSLRMDLEGVLRHR